MIFKRTFTVFELIALVVSLSILIPGRALAKLDPKTTILAWTFEESEGDTVKDITGNGNDGKIIGSVKRVKGKFGNGLELSGANGKISTSTANNVGKTYFTECLWINFKDFATEAQFGYINGKGGGTTRHFYFSSWSSAGGDHNCIHAGVPDLAGNWGRGISTGRIFSKNQWYFVACVIDTKQGFIKTYVDGELAPGGQVAIAPGDVVTTPVDIHVGGTPENYQWINGTIDEVAFFNIALTQEQLKDIMNNGLSKGMAVSLNGKLPTTWASIKER